MVKANYDFEQAFALVEKKNFEEAWKYALPFANAGDSNAQCLVGLLCEHGLGTVLDLQEAERWLRKLPNKTTRLRGTILERFGRVGVSWKRQGCAIEEPSN